MMKKIIDGIVDFFKKLFEKDFAVKIISIIAAIIIWFIVSINVYPTIDRIIYNVPIVIDLEGTYAQANNFKVSSQSETSATVEITGDRGQIGDMTNEDLTLVASAESVINAEKYDLSLELVCSSNKQFSVLKLSPDVVTVDFDEVVTKEIPVKPNMDNVRIAAGYISDDDDIVVVPNTITITGPKDMVKTVTAAYVNVKTDGELSSTYEYSDDTVSLYKGSTEIITTDEISLSKNNFIVHVPILEKQTLPLEVMIINAPRSFDTDGFIERLKYSVEELEVAATSENIKDIESLTIGSIDMREVDIGSTFTFNTADFMPAEYQNLSSIDTVTVTCPNENLYKIYMTIEKDDIQFINAPAHFDYEIITSGFTQFFIGSAESLEQLSYIDVIAQIDLINYDIEARDYKFPVTFSTPAYSDVWCIGSEGALSPKATVTVTLSSDSE